MIDSFKCTGEKSKEVHDHALHAHISELPSITSEPVLPYSRVQTPSQNLLPPPPGPFEELDIGQPTEGSPVMNPLIIEQNCCSILAAWEILAPVDSFNLVVQGMDSKFYSQNIKCEF